MCVCVCVCTWFCVLSINIFVDWDLNQVSVQCNYNQQSQLSALNCWSSVISIVCTPMLFMLWSLAPVSMHGIHFFCFLVQFQVEKSKNVVIPFSFRLCLRLRLNRIQPKCKSAVSEYMDMYSQFAFELYPKTFRLYPKTWDTAPMQISCISILANSQFAFWLYTAQSQSQTQSEAKRSHK